MNNEELLLAVSDMMEQKLLAVSDAMDKKLDEKLTPVYDRLDRIEIRLDEVESEISALKCGQREIREDLRKLTAKVNETHGIALDAFGTSTENRHWLEKSKLPM